MYAHGLLVTVEVMNLADAQVSVFEATSKAASGRYICFDHVVDEERADKLAHQSGMPIDRIRGEASTEVRRRLELSNRKLYSLLSSRTSRSCRDES